MRSIIYVNGYGATDRLDDGNYARYLGEVRRHVLSKPNDDFAVYFCGGLTNRTDLSEAECMRRIWEHLGSPANAKVFMLTEATTTRDGLIAFRDRVGNVPVMLFCEHSRRRTVYYLAMALFHDYEVVGVRFDERSLRLTHRIYQTCFKLPLEMLSVAWPPADKLRHWLRKRHVAKARACCA